ncbi:MAG: InlB B-repeat-containing protein [Lachnospiraceae bacterium]|nr:InlB B-repeat-containing protein [Lachnospiraceae bacterium]
MRRLKRSLAFLLAMLMLIGETSQAFASDVDDSDFAQYDVIEQMPEESVLEEEIEEDISEVTENVIEEGETSEIDGDELITGIEVDAAGAVGAAGSVDFSEYPTLSGCQTEYWYKIDSALNINQETYIQFSDGSSCLAEKSNYDFSDCLYTAAGELAERDENGFYAPGDYYFIGEVYEHHDDDSSPEVCVGITIKPLDETPTLPLDDFIAIHEVPQYYQIAGDKEHVYTFQFKPAIKLDVYDINGDVVSSDTADFIVFSPQESGIYYLRMESDSYEGIFPLPSGRVTDDIKASSVVIEDRRYSSNFYRRLQRLDFPGLVIKTYNDGTLMHRYVTGPEEFGGDNFNIHYRVFDAEKNPLGTVYEVSMQPGTYYAQVVVDGVYSDELLQFTVLGLDEVQEIKPGESIYLYGSEHSYVGTSKQVVKKEFLKVDAELGKTYKLRVSGNSTLYSDFYYFNNSDALCIGKWYNDVSSTDKEITFTYTGDDKYTTVEESLTVYLEVYVDGDCKVSLFEGDEELDEELDDSATLTGYQSEYWSGLDGTLRNNWSEEDENGDWIDVFSGMDILYKTLTVTLSDGEEIAIPEYDYGSVGWSSCRFDIYKDKECTEEYTNDSGIVEPGTYWIKYEYEYDGEYRNASAPIVVKSLNTLPQLNKENIRESLTENCEAHYFAVPNDGSIYSLLFSMKSGNVWADFYDVDRNRIGGIDINSGSGNARVPSKCRYLSVTMYPETVLTGDIEVTKEAKITSIIKEQNPYDTQFYYGIDYISNRSFDGLKIKTNTGRKYFAESTYFGGDGRGFFRYEILNKDTEEAAERDDSYNYPVGDYIARIYVDEASIDLDISIVDLSKVPEIPNDSDNMLSLTGRKVEYAHENGTNAYAIGQWVKMDVVGGEIYKIHIRSEEKNALSFDGSYYAIDGSDIRSMYNCVNAVSGDKNATIMVDDDYEGPLYIKMNVWEDCEIYYEQIKTVKNIEILEQPAINESYEYCESYMVRPIGAKLRVTYEDGTFDDAIYESDYINNFSDLGINYYLVDSSGNRINTVSFGDRWGYRAGNHKLVFSAGSATCSYDYLIKPLADIPEVSVGENHTVLQTEITDQDGDYYYSTTIRDERIKINLNAGDYRMDISPNVYTGVHIYDAYGNSIGNRMYSSSVIYFSIAEAGTYYIDFSSNERNVDVSINESKRPIKIEVTKNDFKKQIMYGFDSPSWLCWKSDTEISITFSDGTKEVKSVRDSSVNVSERTVDGRYISSDIYNNYPVGNYVYRISLEGADEVYTIVPFSIIPIKSTGELKVGSSISLMCNMEKHVYEWGGIYYQFNEGKNTPHIVSLNLTAGETYSIQPSVTGDGSFDLYSPAIEQLYSYIYGGLVFTAPTSGTYYLKVRTPGATYTCEKTESLKSVKVISGPRNSVIAEGNYNGNPLYSDGATFEFEYASGEKELVEYGDDTWKAFGANVDYWLYDDDGNRMEVEENDWIYSFEAGKNYYWSIYIPGYDGEIVDKEKMEVRCVPKDASEVHLTVGDKKVIPIDADGFQTGSSMYFMDLEPGKSYIFRANLSGEDYGTSCAIYSYVGDVVEQNHYVGDSYRNSGWGFIAEEGCTYYVRVSTFGWGTTDFYNDGSCTLLVEEADLITSVKSNGYSQNKFAYGVDAVEPIDAAFTVTKKHYEGKNADGSDNYSEYEATIGNSDFEAEGILVYGIYTTSKTYPKYDSYGRLPKGTYIFAYIIPGMNELYFDTEHPITVVDCVKSYKVVFNSNFPDEIKDVAPVSQTIGTNAEAVLTANKFKCTGYDFVGWATDPDGDVEFADKDVVFQLSTEGETINLYAKWELSNYKINWHLSGGSLLVPVDSTYTMKSATMALPTKVQVEAIEGFEFAGWFKEAEYKTEITEITAGSIGDKDVYAKWRPKSYKVVFEGNGNEKGGATKDQTVYYGIDATLNANGYKSAKAFMYWSYDAAGEEYAAANKGSLRIDNPITMSKVLSETDALGNTVEVLHLYAQWQEYFYISVNYYGGFLPEGKVIPEQYKYGTTTTLPTAVKEGYTFVGWYTEAEFVTKITKITAKMAEDVTLYARWSPINYQVKFNANGGSGKMDNIKLNYEEEKALYANAFNKNGYVFKGWVENASAKSVAVLNESEYDELIASGTLNIFENGATVNSSNLHPKKNNDVVTLAAVWVETTYQLSFDTVGGNEVTGYEYKYNAKADAIDVLTGTAIKLPTKEDVQKDNYEFAGWYKDPDYKTKVTATKGLSGDITLYAKWTAKYSVKFNANSDTNTKSMSDEAMVFGTAKALTANAFTKTGYVFMGWDTDPSGATVVYANKEKIVGCEEELELADGKFVLNLYAVWRNNFVIEYDTTVEDGTTPMYMPGLYVTGYTYGDEKDLPVPIREGYTFGGWYSDEKLKTKAKVSKTTSGDLMLYAKWTGNKYTVNFEANAPEGTKVSGKTSKASMVYGTAKALTKNGFKISGYTFKGWSTKPNGEVKYENAAKLSDHTNELLGFVDVGNYKDNITLYAVWEKDEYSVTYVMNGVVADVVEENVYTVDSGYTLIDEPSRIGYTFMGFYTDKSCKKKATDLKVGTTGDKVFYAKWKANN